jgi:hypothetical protein
LGSNSTRVLREGEKSEGRREGEGQRGMEVEEKWGTEDMSKKKMEKENIKKGKPLFLKM